MMHRVRPLWFIHTIHHSQREVNVFTDLRVHFLESFTSQALVFLPLIALGLKPLALVAYGAAFIWHSRFIHANVRTNFGWLKYVFVSPQYHRIHHSIEGRHRDHNFGAILTVWDRIFGTMYPAFDEYPRSGLEEVEFPPPESLKPQAWVGDLARQLWYPFHKFLNLR